MNMSQTESCPVCGSKEYIYKKKNKGLDLGYCTNCTLAYARPLLRGTEDDVGASNSTITEADFYKGLKENHISQSKIAREKAPKMLKYWRAVLGNKTRSQISILEIGCGTGQYYDAWKSLNVEWTGLEVNKEMLEFCKSKEIPVEATNIMNTKLGKKFDVVFLSQVLEHIIEPNLFLKKIKENMTDNAILHIDVPNHDSLSSLYRRIKPSHPEYGFNLQQVNAYANNDDTFGQLIADKSMKNNIIFGLSNLFGRGSLLVAVATK